MSKLKKRLVFSDYDGTIYIPNTDMGRNVKLIEEYQSLGGKFIIVTGRSKQSITEVVQKYNMKYDYIISNNGAVAFDSVGNKIYKQEIKPEDSNEIIKYLNTKSNIEILFYDERDKIDYCNQDLLKIRAKSYDIDLVEKIEKEVNELFGDKVIAHTNFPAMYYDNIKFAITDIVSIEAGKEKTIEQLLKILQVEVEDVVTVGDGRNDIGMIKKYNGYSMATAERDVKDVATKIFNSIAEVMEYLIY